MATTDWTIPDLLQLSGGYWSTCALHAGVKLDVFTPLAADRLTAAEVGKSCGADPRAMGMMLDSLASLGLLDKQGDLYSATAFSARTLSRSSADYVGHIIMHHHHLVAGWSRLDEAVRSGSALGKNSSSENDESVRESFLMGMFNLAMQLAPRIAASLDLSASRRLLDLGGGPGTYAIHFCLANPEISAVVYDLPTTRKFAEETIARFSLQARITFQAGDFLADPVPGGFDAVWISHILHAYNPADCRSLLAKAVAGLDAGGVLMVQEFILDDDKAGPAFPALFSLNMLLGTESGQAYSGAELEGMMTSAGLSEVRRLAIELPNGAGIMIGRKCI
jgi:SAM-dependent methyltransferase